MKTVHLSLTIDEDKAVQVQAQGSFEDEELARLAQYVDLMVRVRTCTLLQRGIQGLSHLSFDSSGLRIEATPWPKGELYELLHVLRPVTLE